MSNDLAMCLRCKAGYQVGTKHTCGEDVTPKGGVHAHVDGRYDLIPPEAMKAIAMVMEDGAKAGREDDNWRRVPMNVHINHAISHLVSVLMNETDEDHLAHACTRLCMAIATRKGEICKK